VRERAVRIGIDDRGRGRRESPVRRPIEQTQLELRRE
jgi:hypothetical protein